ncbi:MAG TPA: peptide deformylase [Verrucomicrobiae bacterium]
MKLKVRKYGDPILRQKGKRIEKMTPEIKQLVADMFDTMYEARGVGLAAQQVGHALQLTVIDVRGIKDRPSTMEIAGKPVDVEAHMPLVLINPELKLDLDLFDGAEGCLSFPEIFADITRPAEVEVTATNDKGEKISFRAGGLLAKAVQHEFDHLQGILFIDRMASETKREFKAELDALAEETKAELKKR